VQHSLYRTKLCYPAIQDRVQTWSLEADQHAVQGQLMQTNKPATGEADMHIAKQSIQLYVARSPISVLHTVRTGCASLQHGAPSQATTLPQCYLASQSSLPIGYCMTSTGVNANSGSKNHTRTSDATITNSKNVLSCITIVTAAEGCVTV
jgi:hypothetical protein